MKKLRLAYFGSPDFSAEFLEKILADTHVPVEVVLVVTQEDKPVGRSQTLTPSPVKTVATNHNIPVTYISMLSTLPPTLSLRTSTLPPFHPSTIDLALVFAYGRIIKPDLLRASKHGFWNVHLSLLPQFRGASPTVYPLILGADQTGVSLMLMDEEMDHGPIIEQQSYPISAIQTNVQLLKDLATIGYTLFAENVKKLGQEGIDYASLPVQNHATATFTRPLTKDDGFIELSLVKKALRNERVQSQELPLIIQQYLGRNNITEYPIPYASHIVYNMFRGLHPWPGIWTQMPDGKRLKILSVALKKQDLVIEIVQLEGKKPVSFEQFTRAYQLISLTS